MKNIYLAIFFFFYLMSFGQSSDQNYEVTKVYREATQNSISTPLAEEAHVIINYKDGFGRTIQEILSQQSPSGKDVLLHHEYDAFGRELKQFLPYTNQNPSLSYNSNLRSELDGYYNSGQFDNTLNPYSEANVVFGYPLNIIDTQAFPGNDWSIDSNHTVKYEYYLNLPTDNVKIYKAVATWNPSLKIYDISLSENGTYPNYKLKKSTTKNENWTSGKNNTTEEYTNLNGKIVLKRTFNNNVEHDTYYVYDQFGNLTFVLPPLVDTSQTITQTVLDGLCYQYKYDNRNRLVEKKLPGKDWEFIVYDKLNRVVATGPSNSPFDEGNTTKGWLISKYDVFNRNIYTGWYSGHDVSADKRNTLQSLQNNATTVNESKMSSNTIDNIAINYTNNVFPTSGFYLLTLNYYDNYDFPNALGMTIPTSVNNQSVLQNTKGLSTGNWERVLTNEGEFNGNATIFLYDEKLNVIRSYMKNYLGGYTLVATINGFPIKSNLVSTSV